MDTDDHRRAGKRRGEHRRPLWLRAVLLTALLLFILLQPLVERSFVGEVLFGVLFVWLVISGVWSLSADRKARFVAFLLALPTFLASLTLYFVAPPILVVGFNIFACLFLSFVGAMTVAQILRDDTVTSETIFDAVSVYLLIGLVWALGFEVIEYMHNGSFLLSGESLGASAAAASSETFPLLVYYSLATLTTLGYGDIVPTTALARALAALEAVTGQLYLAILIARLVGVHASRQVHRS